MNYDITVIKRKMLVKYPFFGSIVANVEYKESKDLNTAGTDGKVIYYNPDFLRKLSIEEQIFIFSHEVCHIAFNHILRSEGKNHRVWNIATDAVINAFLKRDGLKFVQGGIDIENAISYDAEELYEKLLDDEKKKELQSNKNCMENTSDDSCVGHDTHKMWEDAVKRHNVDQNNEQDTKLNDVEDEIKRKQNECEKIGEKGSFNHNLKQKKKNLETLKETIARQAVNKSDTEIRVVDDIGKGKPLLDWRYYLRETINYEVDWSYKNAYVEDGIIYASLEEHPLAETEIVLDTSGSIDERTLKNFLRECLNILQYSKIKVGCFDTKFYGFYEIKTEEDIENMTFEGGGGTDFNAAIEAFSKRTENKIIFTDGEADMPEISFDAIWIVFGHKKISPNGGKVIQIDDEQMKKLYSFESGNSSRSRYF